MIQHGSEYYNRLYIIFNYTYDMKLSLLTWYDRLSNLPTMYGWVAGNVIE